MNIDADSFTAGNLTGAGKSHIAYQKVAVQARREADSVENIIKRSYHFRLNLKI